MSAHIKAPPARLVNVFNGKKAPEKYFQALSEADAFCAELAEVHELRTRVDEYEAHVAAQDEHIARLVTRCVAVTAERDDLAERLDSLSNAHRITLAALADAKRELANLRREGDVFIGKATGAL